MKIKKKGIEKKLRYECSGCNFRSHNKLLLSVHLMIEHQGKAFQIFEIGCEACEARELHTSCDTTKQIQPQYKTEKLK